MTNVKPKKEVICCDDLKCVQHNIGVSLDFFFYAMLYNITKTLAKVKPKKAFRRMPLHFMVILDNLHQDLYL